MDILVAFQFLWRIDDCLLQNINIIFTSWEVGHAYGCVE